MQSSSSANEEAHHSSIGLTVLSRLWNSQASFTEERQQRPHAILNFAVYIAIKASWLKSLVLKAKWVVPNKALPTPDVHQISFITRVSFGRHLYSQFHKPRSIEIKRFFCNSTRWGAPVPRKLREHRKNKKKLYVAMLKSSWLWSARHWRTNNCGYVKYCWYTSAMSEPKCFVFTFLPVQRWNVSSPKRHWAHRHKLESLPSNTQYEWVGNSKVLLYKKGQAIVQTGISIQTAAKCCIA